ncbi:MAG: hypothetical protein KGL97_18505, partial [Alphaproteobacteria bacterium]|nr:hypothetical protein [Alphaproteobacteria bacterium]
MTKSVTRSSYPQHLSPARKAAAPGCVQLNYEIAGNAQGSVTIQTSQPLKRAQVLPVLEQTLRLNGL